MLRLLNPPTVEMPSGRRARHPGIASSLRAAITGGQIDELHAAIRIVAEEARALAQALS